MNYDKPIRIICPICGTENRIPAEDVEDGETTLRYCHRPDGVGCDNTFAFKVDLQIVTKVYKLETVEEKP
jgi:phage/plasmid primase-like uncharacterized protein